MSKKKENEQGCENTGHEKLDASRRELRRLTTVVSVAQMSMGERGDLKERREGLLNSITVKNEVVARRYFVSGRVQGVGYRNYVEHVAEKLGLSGYVKNRRDGKVEVFAMGTPEQLGALRAALQKGPMMARVVDVMEEPSAVEPKYQGQFEIEFTE